MSAPIYLVGGSAFVVPAQPVDGSGTPNLLATLVNNGEFPYRGATLVTITGIVAGAGPLTGLEITTAAAPNGTHVNRFVNADFNTPVRLLPFSTANPHTTAAGGQFQMQVDLSGVGEARLWASSANGATVSLEIGS